MPRRWLEHAEQPTPLGRVMRCSRCPHDEHVLPCDVGTCPCRDVPVPGIYPFVPSGARAWT